MAKSNKKRLVRFTLSCLMLFSILVSMANKWTGNAIHEIVGMTMLLMILYHNLINKKWYETIKKGSYHFFGVVNLFFNILLVISTIVLLISSIMISDTLFAFLNIKSTMFLEQIHTTSAYWMFICVAVHLGIHFQRFISFLPKFYFPIFLKFTLSLGLIIYATFAFVQRDVYTKLFMIYAFDYWDKRQSIIIWFIDYLSILLAFTILTQVLFKICRNISCIKSTKCRYDFRKLITRRAFLKNGALGATALFLNFGFAQKAYSKTRKNKDIAIIYLTRTNNTKELALMINDYVNADLIQLKTITPYPKNYRKIVEQVSEENGTNFLPQIEEIKGLENYKTVFLGFPTWGMQLPPPMKSLLHKYNFSNKTIIPFNSHAGYGVGSGFDTIKNLASNARVLNGFSVKGGVERDGILFVMKGKYKDKISNLISNWISKIY